MPEVQLRWKLSSAAIIESDRPSRGQPMERGIFLVARNDGVRHPQQSHSQEVIGTDPLSRNDLQQPLFNADWVVKSVPVLSSMCRPDPVARHSRGLPLPGPCWQAGAGSE